MLFQPIRGSDSRQRTWHMPMLSLSISAIKLHKKMQLFMPTLCSRDLQISHRNHEENMIRPYRHELLMPLGSIKGVTSFPFTVTHPTSKTQVILLDIL